jgi:hypothetical protein
VLARVYEHLLGNHAQPVRDGGRLDELRPVPDHGEELGHFSLFRGDFGQRASMSKLLARVRGTVHGFVGDSMHALWYLDWHTGGATVRDRTA